MSEVSGEDIERLANRMAMLVSDDGEADNAGRAVGQLARRLGLSGGDLKQIVMAGAAAGLRPGGHMVSARLEQEIAMLRLSLAQAEEAARIARQDRETLVAENGEMRVAIYRRRANARLRRLVMGLVAIGLGVVGVATVWLGPSLFDPPRLVEPPPVPLRGEPGTNRPAFVRAGGATVYRAPDRSAEPIARLAPASRLVVLRTDWRAMMQWAQVEVDGQLGYVATTDIEMF